MAKLTKRSATTRPRDLGAKERPTRAMPITDRRQQFEKRLILASEAIIDEDWKALSTWAELLASDFSCLSTTTQETMRASDYPAIPDALAPHGQWVGWVACFVTGAVTRFRS